METVVPQARGARGWCARRARGWAWGWWGELLPSRAVQPRRHGDAALVADGRSWTFGELDARMGGFVAALLGAGVRPGDRVALRGSNRVETVVALLGMATAGVTAVLVHPRLTDAEARVLIDDAQVALALDDAGVEAILREGVNAPWPTLPTPTPADALAMIYTSGTSGRAKGAVLTHGAFAASAPASERNLAVDPRRPLGRRPPGRARGRALGAHAVPAGAASGGAAAALRRRRRARRRARRGDARVGGPDDAAGAAGGRPGQRAPRARGLLLVGGAACSPELLEESAKRGVRALATYGMTEMCSQVATQAYAGRPGSGASGARCRGWSYGWWATTARRSTRARWGASPCAGRCGCAGTGVTARSRTTRGSTRATSGRSTSAGCCRSTRGAPTSS